MIRRLPLLFTPQPEGGFAVTSPVVPELISEGDTLEKAFSNVSDALSAVRELYDEQGRSLAAWFWIDDTKPTNTVNWVDSPFP